MPGIDVEAWFDGVITDMDSAMEKFVAAALAKFQDAIQDPVTGIKPGTPGNTTNAPGDLAASVIVDGPIGGNGYYWGATGPTLIYAKQRNFGGYIFARNVTFMRFTIFDRVFYRRMVDQTTPESGAQHYMERAFDAALPAVEILAAEMVGGVVTAYG